MQVLNGKLEAEIESLKFYTDAALWLPSSAYHLPFLVLRLIVDSK